MLTQVLRSHRVTLQGDGKVTAHRSVFFHLSASTTTCLY